MSSPRKRRPSSTRTTKKTRTRTRTKTKKPERVFLGLGANLAEPGRQLRRAIASLSRLYGPLRVAPLYRTAPLSVLPQPDFFNTVVEVRTAVPPPSLLSAVQELEQRAGRHRGLRDAPRPLDVDLLVYGDVTWRSPALVLPHPRLRERGFVLAPWSHLAPDLRLPPDGQTVGALWRGLEGQQRVERLRWARL